MRKQVNKPAIKEQEKSAEKELNKMEASNLPDIKLEEMVVRILKKVNENFN